MKKIPLILFVSFLSINLFSQEAVNAAGTPSKRILPESGDFAIGIDAMPFINFAGNLLNRQTSVNSLSLGSNTFYLKYYLTENTAIKAQFQINNNSNRSGIKVQDDLNVALDPNAIVNDFRTLSTNDFNVGLGYQLYKGSERIRGTAGAILNYERESQKTDFEWGNQMTVSNPSPTNANYIYSEIRNGRRSLSVVNLNSHNLSVGLFAGVEYFFLPKICVGAEMGIYATKSWNLETNYQYETVDTGEYLTDSDLLNLASSSFTVNSRVFDTSYSAGRLYLLFHF